MKDQPPADSHARIKIVLRGAVQGVGFRPFIYRLASELLLTGWVNNSPLGLFIEAEGPRPSLEEFLRRIDSEKPPRSFVQSQDVTWLNAVGSPPVPIVCTTFSIRKTGGFTILLQTARTAARVSVSSRHCRTTG
jgi:hydrogenase maturation factor HypF (carbamoyltransferase family)